jgi:hypothetical protein
VDVGEPAIDLHQAAGRRKVPLRPMNGNLPDDEARDQTEEDHTDGQEPGAHDEAPGHLSRFHDGRESQRLLTQ